MRTERRKMLKKVLPNTYTKLEFIKPSKNNSFIDTEYIPNQDTRVIIEAENTNGSICILLGACTRARADAFELYLQNNLETTGPQSCYDGQLDDMLEHKLPYGQKIHIDLNKNIWRIDKAVKKFDYVKFTCPNSLLLFCSHRFGYGGGYGSGTNKKIYKVLIYDNGSLVRNFVPAKCKSNGVIGLYELVYKKFYTSPNGSTFLGGVSLVRTISLLEPFMVERRVA